MSSPTPTVFDQSSSVQRIRRRCMTPMARGEAPVRQEYSIRRGASRPISAATIGEFGRQFSSFSPDDCFPATLSRSTSALGACPMDKQLHSLARARQRKVSKVRRHEEHAELADLYNNAAATPLLDMLSPTHNISTDPNNKVSQGAKDDMRPHKYHNRIPPAHQRSRPQSGLSFSSKKHPMNDVVPPALQNVLSLPKSKSGMRTSVSGSSSRPLEKMTIASSASLSKVDSAANSMKAATVHITRPASGTSTSSDINALLRTRPMSGSTPQPAEIYPLRSIVY